LSPATLAQRFEQFGPVHDAEYIARVIFDKHRPGDIGEQGHSQSAAMDAANPSSPGQRLKAARKRAKLTQKDLESLIGRSQSAISEFEAGEVADLLASDFVKWCVAVNATAEYVWLGSRMQRSSEEDEAIALLRGANDQARKQAMKALRGMLAQPEDEGQAPITGKGLDILRQERAEPPSEELSRRSKRSGGPGPAAPSGSGGRKRKT